MDALVEPLLQELLARSTLYGGRRLVTLHVLIIGLGVGVLLGLVPCLYGARKQHLRIQERAVAMSSLLENMLKDMAVKEPVPKAQEPSMVLAPTEAPIGKPLAVSFEPGALNETLNTNAGVAMPRLFYEISYLRQDREGASTNFDGLVQGAVNAGFHGLFIAGQAENYYEPGLDAAFERLWKSGVERKDVFVEAKINPNYALEAQPDVPIHMQVLLLVATVLNNLGLTYLDCAVLHTTFPVYEQTMHAWRAMEDAVASGLVKQAGLWNLVPLDQLRRLYQEARVKPAVVQQLYYSETRYEREVRAWCAEHGILVQSQWTLLKDRRAFTSKTLQTLASKYRVAPQMLFFRFLMGQRIVPVITTEVRLIEELGLKAWLVPLSTEDAEAISSVLKGLVRLDDFTDHITAMKECTRHHRYDEALYLLAKRHCTCRQPMPTGGPKVAVVMASHVSRKPRLERLQQTLTSIANQQEIRPHALFASVSASTPELMEGARKAFADFQQAVPGMKLYVACRTHQLSQFLHIASLTEPLKRFALGMEPCEGNDFELATKDAPNGDYDDQAGLSSLWMCFTDDDDIWHPCRSLMYSQVINTTIKQHGLTPVVVPLYVMNKPGTRPVTNPKEVEQLIIGGGADVWQFDEWQALRQPFLEVWQHAVPFRVFLDFLLCTPPATLGHELCDIRFCKFIRDFSAIPATIAVFPAPQLCWMYFYRQHEQGQVTGGLRSQARLIPQDRDMAKALKPSLNHSYDTHVFAKGDQGELDNEGADPVERIIAELRRDVAMFLMYGTSPLPDLVDACVQRGGLNGTADEACWAQLVGSMASLLIPTLAPPGRCSLGGRGYQRLQENWNDREGLSLPAPR